MKTSSSFPWKETRAPPFPLSHLLQYQIWLRMTKGIDKQLSPHKRGLLSGIPWQGTVVEIGPGLGATIPYYAAACCPKANPDPPVKMVYLVEPNHHMHEGLRAAAVKAGVQPGSFHILSCGAESIPLPDSSVDSVLCTLVLCSVPSVEAACREVHRILKPGGKFFVLEHVAVKEGDQVASWVLFAQRLLSMSGIWPAIGDGCMLDRHTEDALKAAPWKSIAMERFVREGGLQIAAPHIKGYAEK